MLERFLELLDVLDVVDADKYFVTHELLRLFYEAFDTTIVVGYCDPETARVLDLVGVKDVFGGVGEGLDVGFEQCIAEDDEDWFVVFDVGEGEAYGLAESLRVVLENSACAAPFRFAFEIIVDSFGLVAGNEDAFRSLER